jgi:hypothetical protein
MRQTILGVSIFLGLQATLFLVLFGVTRWEGRQLQEPAEQHPERTKED